MSTPCPECGSEESHDHLLFDVPADNELYLELTTCNDCDYTGTPAEFEEESDD